SHEEMEKELVEAEADPKKPRKRRNKADGFDENLPRIQVRLTLNEEEKAGTGKTFFSKIKEELDIVPAQARVIEYWQEKAVFDEEDGTQQVVAAARPVHPLGKCLASVQLLAWILVAKYADALPLYRLEGILKRHGGRISRTTMANWIIRLDDVFRPLINLLREWQWSADYLQADETRLQVLKETGKSAQSDKWMWVIRGGPPDRPAVLFEYDPSRSEEVPLRLLDGFKGTLQTDGYAGYNRVCRENDLTRIGCWDHARRKFVEASQAAPVKKKGTKVSKADVAIGKIRKLYAIEKRTEKLPPEEKTRQRRQLAQPVLDDLKAWLDKNRTRVPKDSLTYKAIQYSLNQWELLIGYLADGRLNISNALAENAIRPFAVGRRNWLFADTPRGAKASATIYSLIETAKANGMEPLAYLHHVLQHIRGAGTVEEIEGLLPWNVNLEGKQEG
ncbi:IS66 family transposase, partial [Thiolapillus sp.]|uniref:IS66 family transposase n=1 Tax=Thiolapillus sp. TaxID=2017437 RepID=UPI003AF85501